MSKAKQKVIFVGHEAVYDYLVESEKDWDLQKYLRNASEMSDGLEDDSISSNSPLILFMGNEFLEDPSYSAELLSFLAPYGIVCIIITEDDMNVQEPIIRREIEAAQEKLFLETDGEYNVKTPIYYLVYETFLDELPKVVESYYQDPNVKDSSKIFVKPLLLSMVDEEDLNFSIEEDNYDMVDQEEFYSSDKEGIVVKEPNEKFSGKVVSVTSSKGGSGKSSISFMLAYYLSESSKRSVELGLEEKPLKICLIDMDVRDGQIMSILGATSAPTIMNILDESDNGITEYSIKKGIYQSEKTGVDYILATRSGRSADLIPEKFYADLIYILRSMYDIIILDTSVNYLDPLLYRVSYPSSDKIILITDMSVQSILGMTRWIKENAEETAMSSGYVLDKEKIGIVVNRVIPNVLPEAPDFLNNAARGIIYTGMIPSDPEVLRATNRLRLHEVVYMEKFGSRLYDVSEFIVGENYQLSTVEKE